MDSIQWLIALYIFFMMLALILAVYIFPFRKLIWNRWKLKIDNLRGRSTNPAFIVYPDNSIDEIIIDSSEETFTHKDATYNVRPNRFYYLFGFQYCIYLHNDPEPKELHLDDKGYVMLKVADGKLLPIPISTVFKNPDGSYVAGKIIDGKTYDNLLIRAYNAGMAWMARNSNLMNILLWVTIGLVALGIIVTYWQNNSTQRMCLGVLQNITMTGRVL